MEIIYKRIASDEEPKKEDGAADGEKWRSYVDQTNLLRSVRFVWSPFLRADHCETRLYLQFLLISLFNLLPPKQLKQQF